MMKFQDANGNTYDKPKNTALSLNDGNASLSGSVSYLDQTEGQFERKRWGASLSSAVGAKSSFGVSVRKTTDEDTTTKQKDKYYQTVFGILHAITPQTTLGIVAYDAFRSKGDATRAYLGLQHVFADYITLGFDAGTDWKADDLGKAAIYRGSIQVRLLNDFHLRFGVFDDKLLEEKGNGFGLSWVQPKLILEFAMMNAKKLENVSLSRPETKRKDVSFSVTLRM